MVRTGSQSVNHSVMKSVPINTDTMGSMKINSETLSDTLMVNLRDSQSKSTASYEIHSA